MKRLNLLVSSALVALAFLSPQKTWGMERPSTSWKESNTHASLSHSSQLTNNSLSDFLQDSPLYHQAATEKYRSSVQTLREEIINLQQNVVSAGSTDSQSSSVKKEITQLAEMLALQKEAFGKYGQDREVAQQKIIKEIRELEENKKANEQNINDKPNLKGLYEAQIKDAKGRLETCQKYLVSLTKSETTLQAELETAQKYLKALDQQSSSAEYVKEAMSQKVSDLQALYENHVNGLGSSDIFPHHLPKVVLECLGVSSAQLNHVHTERLFQLFARTLELPYASVQTGVEKEEIYLRQLKAIKQNLNNRLQEDIFCLQLGISMAQNKGLDLDLKAQNAMVEKLLTNPEALKTTINKSRDLETLKGILSSYGGYGEKNPSQFLGTILNESSYGLLGLYIASLEFSPVSSWSNPAEVSCHARLKDTKSPEEFSARVLETVFGILGRHINSQVLENIQEKLQKNSEKPSTPRAQADFYI